MMDIYLKEYFEVYKKMHKYGKANTTPFFIPKGCDVG